MAQSKKKSRFCRKEQSVMRTHDIISWIPDGKSFKIHDKMAFSEQLMSAFFASSKFKSFQLSLNLWGFLESVAKGPNKGNHSHKYFIVRGKPDHCLQMNRIKVKGGRPTSQPKYAVASIHEEQPRPLKMAHNAQQHQHPHDDEFKKAVGSFL
jgi:hypothetical protein